MQPSREIDRLLAIMAALRTPETGCQWDLAQTFESIVPYTIEEAYEVADAVARQDHVDLKDELGDLLLQVVFQSRIAEERGLFDFGAVVEAITEKLIRRHPHVFQRPEVLGIDEIGTLWTKIKTEEKFARKARDADNGDAASDPRTDELLSRSGLLSGVALALPGLTRAVKLQARASEVGFDWEDARIVLSKIREETDEIAAALDENDPEALSDEIGDLLFALANLARHLDLDPEASIRRANRKFERRFGHIEAELERRGRPFGSATLAEMDALWNEAKAREKSR